MKKTLKIFALISFCLIILIANQSFATQVEAVNVTTEAELREALESGKNVVLSNDIEIKEISNSTADGDRNKAGIVLAKSVTLNGNGKKITSNLSRIFEIYATEGKCEITFENVTVENSLAGGRCVDTRTDNIVFNVNNSTLKTLKGAYDQTITVGGNAYTTPIEINLNKSKIIAGSHYAIIVFNPVKLNINNCEAVAGFAALYMKEGSAGSEVSINNSTLTGTNSWPSASGIFGTITLEDAKIKIDAKNSTIIAKETNTANEFVLYDKVGGSTITTYNTKLQTDKYSMMYKEGTKVILGDKTILVDPSITSEEDLKDFVTANAICKKTGTNEYTVYKQYSITVKDVEGGKLTVDKTKVINGEKITLAVAVQEGYEFKTIEISDGKKTKKISDGEYVFDFESDVTVTPVFESLAPVVEIPDEVVVDVKTEEMLLGSLEKILKEDEELATLVKNNKVEVEVVLEDIKVEEKEKEVIEKAIGEKVKDIKVAKYLDISVNVKVKSDNAPEGKVVGNLEELKEKLTFTVVIPTDLPKVEEGYSRTYYIVRNHNGVVEILDAKVSEDGKSLNFASDKFSTYALAYVDEKVENKVEDKVDEKVEDKVDDKVDDKVEVEEKKEEKDETPKTGTINFTMYVIIAVVVLTAVKISIKRKNGKYSK